MTAARLVSLLATEGLAIDQLTARVTAFNIMDHLAVPGVPARQLRMVAIAFYELGDESAQFIERVRFVGPTAETIMASLEAAVLLAARQADQMPTGHRSIHVLWGSTITSLGDHKLILERRANPEAPWESVSTLRLPVVIEPNPFLNSAAPAILPA